MANPELLNVGNDAKSVLIALNPRSGSTNRRIVVDGLREELVSRGFDAEILSDLKHLKTRSSELLAGNQLRTVVSAGGDGTASLLVNELDPHVPLTIFPMGTANLLAQFVDAALDINKTVETISAGFMTRMDVGLANDRIFLVVASCGFDADVVDRIHSGRTGHITYWSYSMPMINSIAKYKFPKMRLTADGKSLTPSCWTFVLNVPKYALGLRFVDGASADDGLLDVCTFSGGGFFRGLYYFFAVLLGGHRGIRATEFTQFKEMSIDADEPIPFELDGDPGGYLPLTIKVIPGRLAILVPANWRAN